MECGRCCFKEGARLFCLTPGAGPGAQQHRINKHVRGTISPVVGKVRSCSECAPGTVHPLVGGAVISPDQGIPPKLVPSLGGGFFVGLFGNRICGRLPFSRSPSRRFDQLGVFPEIARQVRKLQRCSRANLRLGHRPQTFHIGSAAPGSERWRAVNPWRLLLIVCRGLLLSHMIP